MIPLSPMERTTLIAYANDAARFLIDKWGGAVVGDPVYSQESGWYIIVIGLLDDIQMDTIKVLSNGTRQTLV